MCELAIENINHLLLPCEYSKRSGGKFEGGFAPQNTRSRTIVECESGSGGGEAGKWNLNCIYHLYQPGLELQLNKMVQIFYFQAGTWKSKTILRLCSLYRRTMSHLASWYFLSGETETYTRLISILENKVPFAQIEINSIQHLYQPGLWNYNRGNVGDIFYFQSITWKSETIQMGISHSAPLIFLCPKIKHMFIWTLTTNGTFSLRSIYSV